MARPRPDESTIVRLKLRPPVELKAAQRKLWDREFGRFPPDYFVPADIPAMLEYLQWTAEADKRRRIAAKMTSPGELDAANRAWERAARIRITLQRALRMFPSTRGGPDRQRSLANDPAEQLLQGARPGEAPWRTLLRNAREGGMPD